MTSSMHDRSRGATVNGLARMACIGVVPESEPCEYEREKRNKRVNEGRFFPLAVALLINAHEQSILIHVLARSLL